MINRCLFHIIFILFALGFIFINLAFSQGLIFDRKKFDKGDKLRISRADKYPDSFSLKQFTPFVFEQYNSTCVAYSIATARTIAYAYNRKITNKIDIALNAFSPLWIYNRSKSFNDIDCSKGLNIEKAINDLINIGAQKLINIEFPKYAPFSDIYLCDSYSYNMASDLKVSAHFKAHSVYRINTIEGIKLALSSGMPVVVAMNFSKSLKTFSSNYISTFDLKQNLFGHSVVIVGYNDCLNGGSFELMNSWGTNWGNNGFAYIKYGDIKSVLLGAYAIYCLDKPNNVENNFYYFMPPLYSDSDQMNNIIVKNYEYKSIINIYSNANNCK